MSITNPLLELHRQAEADLLGWADIQIVETFGEPQAEYAAVRKSIALIDLPQRGILEMTGKDRLPFLNNLLTNQIWDKATKTGLSVGSGAYGFMLNVRGRIVADLNVLEFADRTLIETDARLIEPLRQLLDLYLFAEDVKLTSRLNDLHEIALHGNAAANLLGATLEKPLQCARANLFGVDISVWRDDPCGVPGYHLILPTESAKTIWMNLISKFATPGPTQKRQMRPIGWAAFNATRIEAGRAMLGIDFDAAPISSAAPGKKTEVADAPAGALPIETGQFDRAVSVTKGCYLGQEIVARMHARNQVARQIAGIKIDGGALPMAGTAITDSSGATVGVVTSSTVSPVLSNAAIALALMKRPHFEIGAKVNVPAEGEIREAIVVALPFYPENKMTNEQTRMTSE